MSIALTNAYRTRLLSLERRVATQARSAWPTIETFDDTAWPQHIGTVVTRAQRESVRATAGYLSSLLRSNRKPGRVALDTSRYAGVSRDGRPIVEALETALIGVTAALKDGREPAVALSIGLTRGLRMAQFETIQAGRDALLDATDEDERFTGWERAVAGTCAACMALSGATGPHFEVHPSCQCVPQPTVSGSPQSSSAAAYSIRERLAHWKNKPLDDPELLGAEANWAKNLDGIMSTNAEMRQTILNAARQNTLSPDFQRLMDKYGGGLDNVILLDGKLARQNNILMADLNLGKRLGGTTFLADDALSAGGYTWSGVLRHEFAHSMYDVIPSSIKLGFREKLATLPRTKLANRDDRLEFTDYTEAWAREDEAFCEAVRVVFDPDFSPSDYSPQFQEMAKWLKSAL